LNKPLKHPRRRLKEQRQSIRVKAFYLSSEIDAKMFTYFTREVSVKEEGEMKVNTEPEQMLLNLCKGGKLRREHSCWAGRTSKL